MGPFPAILSLLLLLFHYHSSTVQGKEYYVSVVDGSDDNLGTIDSPWKHVQKAVSVLQPGDTCILRAGTYTEQVHISGLAGKEGAPITIKPYPGEYVLFDGTTSIKGTWEKHTDAIHSLKIDYDVWQLFVDDEMLINARWPNAYWYDKSVFDYTKWGYSSSDSTYNLEQGMGVMIDNGTKNLAKSGINATGAIAILNIGQWLTWAGKVTHHTPGSHSFMYSIDPKPKAVHFIPRNCRYFLEDKLEFLDSPTEWFFNPKEKRLYLWLNDTQDPNKHDIRGKISTYAFTIDNNSSFITLSDINFFATTVYISGTSKLNDVNNIQLNSCYFSYPSYTRRALGSTADPNTTTIYYHNDLITNAGGFVIFNNTFEYSDGTTILYRGADGLIKNNIWRYNDFTCVGGGNLFASKGVRDNFVRNIVHSNGPSVGFSPGFGNKPDRELGLSIGSNVHLNLFYDLKYLQNDGAHIQTEVPAQNGTVIEYNWCYETMKYGIRFDRVNQANASWGYNATMRYNVVWTTGGTMLKGDYHHYTNNLAFNNLKYFDLGMFGYPGDGVKGENTHSVITGNILEHGACTSNRSPTCPYPIPGHYEDNVEGDVQKVLQDPENLDYRPLPDSNLITNSVGPYGKESMDHGGVYWIPGRQKLGSSFPIPPNGSITAKCNAHLMWLTGYDAISHDVYFGTKYATVLAANVSSPEYKGNMNIPSNIFDPDQSLKPGVMYYWRVDSVRNESVSLVQGQVWNFMCQ